MHHANVVHFHIIMWKAGFRCRNHNLPIESGCRTNRGLSLVNWECVSYVTIWAMNFISCLYAHVLTKPVKNTLKRYWFNRSQFYHFIMYWKWNESGFRPPLCTYRLNWARRTSWGWWDDWDDTVLQTQDSKFEPWRSEAELATSRSRRLPTILTFRRGWGRSIFCFFQTTETGNRTPNSGVKGSGANHYPSRAPALYNLMNVKNTIQQANLCKYLHILMNAFKLFV